MDTSATGRPNHRLKKDGDGNLLSRSVLEYRNDKQLKTHKIYSNANHLLSSIDYTYRQDGLLEEIKQLTPDYNALLSIRYTYDKAGKRKEILRTPGKGPALKAVASYQADGKLAKVEYWQGEVLLLVAEITYEKNGAHCPDLWEVYDSLNFEIEM